MLQKVDFLYIPGVVIGTPLYMVFVNLVNLWNLWKWPLATEEFCGWGEEDIINDSVVLRLAQIDTGSAIHA